MAEIKKYNLKGVAANVELGKKGSYISGNADAVSFFTVNDELQKVSIANATAATHAVTKAQLDDISSDLIQHIVYDFDFNSGSSNIANISAGTRIISVTVDIPTAFGGTANNQSTYVEIGDSGNASRFIRASDVDVLAAGQYHSQYQYEYDSADTLSVNVVQGSATSGSGTVSILFSTGIITVTDYGSISSASSTNNDLGNIA